MLITVDTLDFAVKDCSVDFILKFLNLEMLDFSDRGKFRNNYNKSLYVEGITIGYESIKSAYSVYVSFSGKGCRLYEDLMRDFSFDWHTFIQSLLLLGVSFRRIDIAVDDHTDALRIDRIYNYYKSGKYASSFKSAPDFHFERTEQVYFGSPQSNYLIRIYNKALERGYVAGDQIVNHYTGEIVPFWYRIEMQLRDERACQFIDQWISGNDLPSLFCGHVLESIRFLTKKNDKSNSQRINVASWWLDFCHNAERIKFVSSDLGSNYNAYRLRSFVNNQAASSVKTLIYLDDLTPDQLYSFFMRDNVKLNKDQRALINCVSDLKDLARGPWRSSDFNDLPEDPGVSLDDLRRSVLDNMIEKAGGVMYRQLDWSDVNES